MDIFDKKRSIPTDVPAGLSKLGFKRWLLENTSGIDGARPMRLTQHEPDGEAASIRSHGKYQKVRYAKPSKKPTRTIANEYLLVAYRKSALIVRMMILRLGDSGYSIITDANVSGLVRDDYEISWDIKRNGVILCIPGYTPSYEKEIIAYIYSLKAGGYFASFELPHPPGIWPNTYRGRILLESRKNFNYNGVLHKQAHHLVCYSDTAWLDRKSYLLDQNYALLNETEIQMYPNGAFTFPERGEATTIASDGSRVFSQATSATMYPPGHVIQGYQRYPLSFVVNDIAQEVDPVYPGDGVNRANKAEQKGNFLSYFFWESKLVGMTGYAQYEFRLAPDWKFPNRYLSLHKTPLGTGTVLMYDTCSFSSNSRHIVACAPEDWLPGRGMVLSVYNGLGASLYNIPLAGVVPASDTSFHSPVKLAEVVTEKDIYTE